MTTPEPVVDRWWRDAVVYQVYVRSFADGSADGLGDLTGLINRLPYLSELGVDAVWITPWYSSPMKDAGYDVADHRAIDPVLGSMADAELLVQRAHERGLRVLLDLVPNHTSDRHPWFQQALLAGPGSPERGRYLFRAGRGDEPPNDWISEFGGPAWTQIVEPTGDAGEWYLHLFASEQPDLNWSAADVQDDVERTLRFWFDKGVDGFRIDVAHALVKQDGLPDVGPDPQVDHPHWNRPEVHEIYRHWRTLADAYVPPRVFVAEAWVQPPTELAQYVRPDELHSAFNFDFLTAPWEARQLREVIDVTIASHHAVGASPTWVLANHDVARTVSRYARPQTHGPVRYLREIQAIAGDLDLGLRRARAAALLMLALPGGAYIYQGEELGLPEVEDLPPDRRRDPIWERSGRTDPGRDGCRVPLPWEGASPPYGFSPAGTAVTWLPQPADWARLTVQAQSGDPSSILELYRAALELRHKHPALGEGALRWLPSPEGTLRFSREPGFQCLVNLSQEPLAIAPGLDPVLASEPLEDADWLAPDTAIWLAHRTSTEQKGRSHG